MRSVNGLGLDLSAGVLPPIQSEPAKIQRAGPTKAFVDDGVVQHERPTPEPDHYTEKRQSKRTPSTAEKRAIGPGLAPSRVR
jgi:hypothetical protein